MTFLTSVFEVQKFLILINQNLSVSFLFWIMVLLL